MKPRHLPLLLGAAGAAWLSSVGGSAGATTTSTAPSIPPGTVLRVGEQLKNLSTVLSLGGQDKDFPYTVQYAEFVGGPPMLQAFQGGALDVGYIASTPLIFAQAAGQPIRAVAGWASQGSSYALVSAPGNTTVTSWAALKGKRVAFQQGTALESALLEGLKSAGLKLSDITPVNLPATQVATALQGGSADAGIEVEPLLSAYLQSNPTAHVIARPAAVTEKAGFLVATSAAVHDKATSAAIQDYLGRLVAAYAYLKAHPEAVVQTVYQGQYGLSATRAQAVSTAVGPTTFFSLPGGVVGPQQNLANLYFAAGAIPAKVAVAREFDPRYNAVIAKAARS